jgi:predicted Rossmann-fold nucleotide-binding protein
MERDVVLATRDDLLERWPDLRGSTVVGLDLRSEQLDWGDARVEGTVVLGCQLPSGVAEALVRRGADVVGGLEGLPFPVYRSGLYSYDELTAEVAGETSLDEVIGTWFRSARTTSQHDTLVRAIHDAMIETAVARFVDGRRVVGVMGGHGLARDAPMYRRVAELGRTLTRAGWCVATGGGPGVMEAANLGAWLAPFPDDQLDHALGLLREAPSYSDAAAAYTAVALAVRTRWPSGGESLAVPTWVYLDEPTGAFASHIAKYFTNSIREDGLLAIARSGVVYAPGGAGTTQELFTDTAQNSLTLYGVRSPMVFFDRPFFTEDRPELVAAVRRQAAEFGWGDLVTTCDEPAEVETFLREHDPDGEGAAGVERRRRHPST